MKISNRLFVLVMALCSVGGLADQLPGIAEFTDGEPALAEEVNGNNLVISDKAQELEARILQLENVSDRLVRDEDTARYGGARSAARGAQGRGQVPARVGSRRRRVPLASGRGRVHGARSGGLVHPARREAAAGLWAVVAGRGGCEQGLRGRLAAGAAQQLQPDRQRAALPAWHSQADRALQVEEEGLWQGKSKRPVQQGRK